ncbi:hypothetical protein BZG01_04265 [Labilibaculum manganireducens]|uniref:Uncharacterized protein n=1 Tax=Labilibaculum manganireducens TaxID=1940525 RepID=A0A2N3IDS9_9BACT|nr:hypothetical protein BZG01_04265 [Labilibaculum manganireducens]
MATEIPIAPTGIPIQATGIIFFNYYIQLKKGNISGLGRGCFFCFFRQKDQPLPCLFNLILLC